MDKSSGNSDSRDMTLGCGPGPSASLSATLSPTSSGAQLLSGISLPPPPPPLTLNITTTTGGSFTVMAELTNSVENLKKIIAKKLKVAKDRICLLHREKELQDGSLKDNGLMDGSKIILIPNVETGLLTQRPENTVMQALESLNDSQVNDFLSGKTPLNLSMRLGDHMMLIQLQLSTVNPSSPSSSSTSRSRSSQRSSRSSATQTLNSHQNTNYNNSNSSSSSSSTSTSHTNHFQHHHHSSASRKLDVDSSLPSTSTGTSKSGSDSTTYTSSGSKLRRTKVIQQNVLSHSEIRPGSLLTKRDFEKIQSIVKSISMTQQQASSISQAVAPTSSGTSSSPMEIVNGGGSVVQTKAAGCCAPITPTSFSLIEQSPIKSLSNLVSSPIKTTSIKNIPIGSHPKYCSEFSSETNNQSTASGNTSYSDSISAKLSPCLCSRLNNKNCEAHSGQSGSEASTSSEQPRLSGVPIYKLNTGCVSQSMSPISSSNLLHKTANNPIVRPKHRHHHHHHHHHHYHGGSSSSNSSSSSSSSNKDNSPNRSKRVDRTDNALPLSASSLNSSSSSNSSSSINDSSSSIELDDSGITVTDTRTLAEASRNLTQTLRKLSKEVFTSKIDLANEDLSRKTTSGAVIESMKNHGKGIYSGTFSGTLNPALQDRYGRPKRDISTVIHILNDLLSATPQYSRGARISFEAPSTSSRSKQSSSSSKSQPASSELVCVKCAGNKSCVYGECNGHSPKTPSCNLSLDDDKISSTCECMDLSASSSTAGERHDGQMCVKCATEMENNKTKCKLDQLRLVMQQRKQKREARKLKGAPYGARVLTTSPAVAADTSSGTTTTASATASTIAAPLASSNEVTPNHIVEEVDTAA